jgi:hypothetical protein
MGTNGMTWRKSSYSGSNGGDCVEVGTGLPGKIAVRDTKDREGPALAFGDQAWSEFVKGIKHGEFELG